MLEKARVLGIGPDALADMALRAAKTTKPGWHRRFHEFYFAMEGNTVTDFMKLDKEPENVVESGQKLKSNEFLVYEECPHCDGAGCSKCTGGEVAVVRKIA